MSKIITISREFGSGGRTIGKMVAKELGIPCYDKEIVRQLSIQSGFAEDFIKSEGEYASSTNSFLFNLSQIAVSPMTLTLSLQQQLYILQSNLIKELAEKGPCVIVGRCSDYILKNRTDVVNVFIHANDEFRKKHIVDNYGEREDVPQKRLKDMDAKRRVYYKNFTYRDWGVCKNYDIALDSSKLGLEQCAKIIVDIAK